jgi:OPA family glycerol-3-phosphate transporter-like MFS transporter
LIAKKTEPYIFITILSWFIYVTVYFGRLNLSIAIPLIEAEYSYSKTTLGFLASGFFVSYAGGQFFNGLLGDRFNPRYLITIGTAGSALTNFCFGLFPSFPVMFVSWVANGYFQSMLWGPMLRTISEQVPVKHHNNAVFLMATSPSVGFFLSYTALGKITILGGWRVAFILPGILLVVMAAVWFIYPGVAACKTAGVSPAGTKAVHGEGYSSSSMETLFRFFIKRKLLYIVVLGILIGAVKEGLTLWGPSLLSAREEIGVERAFYLMSLIPVVSLLVIIFNGLIINSKRIDLRRLLVVFVLLACVAAFCLRLFVNAAFFVVLIAFYALMVLTFSANNLMTSYLPLEYRDDGRISTAAGIIDSAFYLGAAMIGPAAGAIVDRFGWSGFYTSLAVICTAAFVAAGLMTRFRAGKKRISPSLFL